MTQREVADVVGVGQGTVSRDANATKEPEKPHDTVEDVANATKEARKLALLAKLNTQTIVAGISSNTPQLSQVDV